MITNDTPLAVLQAVWRDLVRQDLTSELSPAIRARVLRTMADNTERARRKLAAPDRRLRRALSLPSLEGR